MPNDPRLKFKKKMYDASRNIIYFQGSGGGRLRSIFEDGTPTDEGGGDTGGGGTGGGGTGGGTGGGGGVTPRDIPIIPQVEKPTLDPGAISGITIGSIAAAAALTEAARRTLEEQRRRRGMQQVSQRDGSLSSRQSGVELIRTRPRRIPVQPEFVELGSSSRSTSFDTQHSSGSSTPDLQSSRSRSSSGASTPSSGELSSLRPNARGFQQQPSALAAIAPIVPPPQRPNVPLNLQQEIEMRQLEIRMPTTSGGRIKTLQNEINALEEQIRASGTPYTSLEERINLAMNTQLPKPALAPALVPVPAPAPAPVSEIIPPVDQLKQIKSEITLIENQLVTETNLSTKNAMKEQLKTLKKQATALEKTIAPKPAPKPAPVPVERPAPPPDSIASRTRSRAGPDLNRQLEQVRREQELTRAETIANRAQQKTTEQLKIVQADLAIPNVPLQERYLSGRRTTYINQLKKANNEISKVLLNKDIPEIRRRALLQQQEEFRVLIQEVEEGQRTTISKTVTAEVNTTVETPANDNLRATQPTREFESRMRPVVEGTEMRPLGRNYFPEIAEIVQAAMQQMGSRRPLERGVKIEPTAPTQPSEAGRAALERARTTQQGLSTDRPAPTLDELRIIGPEVSERMAAGVGFELGDPRGPANRERIRQFIEEPTAPEPARRPRPVEEMGEEIGGLRTQNAIAELNDIHDFMMESAKQEGFVVPEAPESIKAQGELEVKRYQYEQALEFAEREGLSISDVVIERGQRKLTGKALSKKKQLQQFQEVYERARIQEGGRPRAAAAPAETRAAAPEARAAPREARAAPAEMRTAPEAMSARSVLAPEVSARVPLLTAPEPAGPNVRSAVRRLEGLPEETTPSAEPVEERIPLTPEEKAARLKAIKESQKVSAAEQKVINEQVRTLREPETNRRLETIRESQRTSAANQETINRQTERLGRPVVETRGMPGPSPPPSAPASGTATPQEGATVERTPAERASLAEEVRLGLNKRPGRQKVKQNIGKPKTTTNPLERFVAPQFRNAPNFEIHPGAKSLSGALSELGSRVPRLVPTREVLISAGHTALAEGGGAVAGFFAGSYAGQKMNEYFVTHPPKNRGEEFGQALATNMVALAAGNLTSKVVAYVIKQGARVAVGAAISGSLSSAGAGGSTAVLEAVVFATVATTTQYFTTKALEDAGYSHEYSRSQGSLAATLALMDLEMASWLLKGGPVNLYADAAFIVSELFIIGFGIWSYFEEKKAGAEEDAQEAATKADREEYERQIKERNESIERIKITNNARAAFMVALETRDYNFDELYDELTDRQKRELGISTPESKAAFQRQVESAFDPMGMFAEPPSGLVVPEVLTPLEQQRRDVFNSYINWYIGELRGETQPPFNFNDPKVVELNEYSGGTWESAARVSATTSHMQAERVHPLIENAQNEIINAFHNERKTIENMPDDVVAYANLDPNFRKNYEDYIVADAQAQILLEFNNTQHTYRDMDPELLAIADRDPNFRAAADAYYQVLANQARDLNLSISTVAHLNSLMENEQVIEIGKLNDARNAIIQKNMAENQAAIDSYNANIVQAINMYGDNFEAIIRNINEQSLLSGHTFLYASTRADLYRQLHMEMPEIELVDPGDGTDPGDATYRPAKGRKVGDTALYGYRHYLTDEQNQELEDMIARGEITRDQEEDQAIIIRERDRYIYEETDKERADNLNMTLPEYYTKFGIPVDPYQMEIVDFHTITTTPTNGRVRQRDGTIFTYRNGILVNKEKPVIDVNVEPVVSYNPSLLKQPDGRITMPDGSVRTYKDGKVTSVLYPPNTKPAQILTIDQINALEAIPPYEQLKTMYPQAYQSLLKKYAGDPDADSKIEETLARGHKTGLYNPNPDLDPTNPDGTPVTPVTPDPTPVTPVAQVLFTGERKMPDGTTRFYRNGKVAGIDYPAGFPIKNMLDAKGIKDINKNEGDYYDPNPPTPVTPVTPVTPTEPLKNGIVNMPDGSIRTYENGLVVFVKYPGAIKSKTPAEINKEEGIRDASYTAPVAPVTPVAPVVPLQQGVVKMPDGSKRMYIDGKVVSVAYPDGVTGPTINQINATEGIKKAEPDSNNPVNPVAPVDPGGLPTQIETPTPAREPTYEELQVMYGGSYRQYLRSYANEARYTDTPTSPERQAEMMEALLRAEHTNRTQAGTAAPLPPPTTTPTPTPTTNQPLPFVPGAKSYEYADSGTQVAPTPAPTPTTPSGGGPSDYRPRQAEPMQINNP